MVKKIWKDLGVPQLLRKRYILILR
ncbi:tRNA lysidine(34) synthetase TilS [Nostoc sp.]